MSRKPNCSYNCLIGMALKSSSTGKLPVGDIYRFFEREFPYFLTATEPWKNSLRHSLSLGHFFRKFNSDRMMTKKGHLWEVEPHKAAELDKEIYMFLAKTIPENLPNSPQLSMFQAQMAHIYLDSTNSKNGSPFPTTLIATPGYFTQRVPDNCTPNTIPFPDSLGCHSGFSGTTSSSPIRMSADTISRTKSHAALKYDQNPPKQMTHSPPGPSTGLTKSGQHLETPHRFVQTDGMPLVSEEALQLIQFCNHCSFELSVNSPDNNLTSELDDSSQKADSSYTKIMESSEQIDDMHQTVSLSSPPVLCEEDVDNTHYPFITEPRGDCNETLAKLNGGGYRTEPGAPRELQIKKCLRGKRMNGILRKNSASLENAIRPVGLTWNSWWEREYVISLMNDYIATNSNGENHCRENDSYYPTKKPHWQHSKKKLQYCFLTPSKPSRLEPASVSKSESGKITGDVNHKHEDRVNMRSSDWDNKWTNEKNDAVKVKSPQKCLIDLREKLTRKKMASIYANLRLIISIPFHKLIIHRQVKKNCGEGEKQEGGKHRIFTGALR